MPGDYGEEEIYILKLNPEGTAIWLKPINGKDLEYCAYNDLSFDHEANFYIGGGFASDSIFFNENISLLKDLKPLNYFDLFYAKYDRDGKCLWAKSFVNGIDIIDDMSIHVLPSNHLIFSGNYSNKSFPAGNKILSNLGNSDIFVLLAKNNGEIITGISIGNNKDDYDSQLASDGKSLYIFGSFASDELKFNDAVLLHDTTDGSMDCFLTKYSIDSLTSTTELNEQLIEIGLYPNPVAESLSLQLPANVESSLLFYNIMDINGRFITSGLFKSNQASILVKSLPSGEYIIRVGVLSGVKYVAKFVRVETIIETFYF